MATPILEQEESRCKSKQRTREKVRRFEFVGCDFSSFGLRYSLRKPMGIERGEIEVTPPGGSSCCFQGEWSFATFCKVWYTLLVIEQPCEFGNVKGVSGSQAVV